MAEIFLAFATKGPFAGQAVVLKRILAEQREDESALQMLLNEARLTATLSHPNVAQVIDLEVVGDDILMVIEFIQGANMEEIVENFLQRREPIPVGFSVSVIRDAALAIAHAHSQKDGAGQPTPIVHRDVTPRNIMVNFAGTTKVLDFGIARAMGAQRRTVAGMVRGTTAYMSPEQAIGKEVSPQTDLFSLGIVFHEMLTGQRLFHRGNPGLEMAAVYEAEIPLPSKINPAVPKAVDAVVMKALERPKERRYQSALDFMRDLSMHGGSVAWSREEVSDLVRQRFSKRQIEIHGLVSRIPVMTPINAATDFDEPEHTEQISRASLNQSPMIDPGPEPKTDSASLSPTPMISNAVLEKMFADSDHQKTEFLSQREKQAAMGDVSTVPGGPAAPRVSSPSRPPSAVGLPAVSAPRGPSSSPSRAGLATVATPSRLANVNNAPARQPSAVGLPVVLGPPKQSASRPMPDLLETVTGPLTIRRNTEPFEVEGALNQQNVRDEPDAESNPKPDLDQFSEDVRLDITTETDRGKLVRKPKPAPTSRLPLLVAAVAASVVGALAGAVIYKSFVKPQFGRLSLITDRPATVVLSGQTIGSTPLKAVLLPAGKVSLEIDDDDGNRFTLEATVPAAGESKLDVALDTLPKLP